MPTFGEYETVGEPLAVVTLQGHTSTVWRVRKGGAPAGPEAVLKCYAPHRKARAGADEAALNRDRGLEFLEGIKQLKKVHSGGARQLTPIHDLGIASDGVWYVTDYYPRGSLQALIGRRAKVDSSGLRQIVRCIVAGCLALKRSRGYAHGNLKAANVFLAGKPQTLSKTPMVLADPFPAAPLQLAQLDAADRREVDELLHQVMEVQDLHALGEIILQLVERRQIRSGYDYNYPVVRSELWDSLGKDGEWWRQTCNQLLDPQLSLGETNFESLAKKFPAPASGNTLLVATSVVLAAGLVGGGVYGYTVWHAKRQQQLQRQQFQDSVAAAQAELNQNDLAGARQKIEDALKWKPQDPDAVALSNTVATAISQQTDQLNKLLAAGNTAEQNQRWAEALTNFAGVARLARALGEARQGQAAQKEADFSQAMDAGARFLANDPSNAEQQARLALAQKPEDPAASNLLRQAAAALNQIQAQVTVAQQRDNLKTAINEGWAAERQQQWSDAAADFGHALALAQALGDGPDGQLARRERDYSRLLSEGEEALRSNQPQAADDKARAALKLGVTDPSAAADLQKRAQVMAGQLANQTRQEKLRADLNAKMSAGRQAEQQKQWGEAAKDFRAAADLANNLGDSGQARTAQTEQHYSQLLGEGEAALQGNQPQAADDKARAALKLAVADTSAAADLRQRAQNQIAALANQTRQEKLKADLNAKMSAGRQAEQQKQWGEAAKDFGAAADLANNLGDSARARTAQTEQHYSQLLGEGEAALQGNQPQAADDKARAALKLAVADTSAAVDLQSRAAKQAIELANAAKLAKQKSDFEALMAAGQQAETQANWPGAVTNFSAAMALSQGLGDAPVRSAQTEAGYSQAMDTGTKALADNPAQASGQAQLALAKKPGDAAATALAQKAAALVRKAQEAVDLPLANTAFAQGNYDDALALCAKHSGVSDFDLLAKSAAAEKTAYQRASEAFAQGDYSFLDGIRQYQGKKCFSDLLAQARPEASVYQTLESLTKTPSNWGQVNSALDPSKNGFIKKPGFDRFRTWAQQNDPAVALDKQLSLFKVWFGLKDNGDKSIIDPYTHSAATKLEKGLDLSPLYDQLTQLSEKFQALGGDQSAHLSAIKDVKKAMDDWQ